MVNKQSLFAAVYITTIVLLSSGIGHLSGSFGGFLLCLGVGLIPAAVLTGISAYKE